MRADVIAWSILVGGFGLPLLHVLLSPRSGPWRPPAGSRCPLGPRSGWLVLVLLLGPLGWLLYLRARARASASHMKLSDERPPSASSGDDRDDGATASTRVQPDGRSS